MGNSKRKSERIQAEKEVEKKIVTRNNPQEEEMAENSGKKELERETLSVHETLAVYKGRVVQKNNFWRSPADNLKYPDTIYEDFEITEYIKYEAKAKLCDKEKKQQGFRVELISEEFMEVIRNLEEGDEVELHWNHDYVTIEQNNQTCKFPERVITKLKKK